MKSFENRNLARNIRWCKTTKKTADMTENIVLVEDWNIFISL